MMKLEPRMHADEHGWEEFSEFIYSRLLDLRSIFIALLSLIIRVHLRSSVVL